MAILRRPGARPRETDGDGKVMVVGAVFVVVLFAFAHHIGGQYSARQGLEKEEVLQKKLAAFQKEGAACKEKLEMKSSKRSDEETEYVRANQRLTTSMRDLQTEISQIQDETHNCEAQLSIEKEAWREKQDRARAELFEKTVKHQELSEQASILVGNDAQTKILIATLRKFAKDHAELHRQLGDGAEIQPESPEYVDALIAKWRQIDKDFAGDGAGPLSKRQGEILPLEESEKVVPIVSLIEKYDPDTHAAKIFQLGKDAEGKWKIPGWNGRQGTNPLVKKGGALKQIIPVTTLNKNLRTMYQYALCGIGQNITGFMFPDAFKRCDDCPVEYMRTYLETPVVQFCESCQPVHELQAFKVLCNGFQPSIQYGGLLFWRTRSRIRFKDSILDDAKKFIDEVLTADGAKVLSVHIPAKQCQDRRGTTLAFQKLLDNPAHKRYEEISADPEERCNPPMGLIVETIEKHAKKIRQQHEVNIYISAPEWTDAQFEELKKHTKLFSFKNHFFRNYPSAHVTRADAIDTMIMAWSDTIIVDRFSQKSVQVIENHLLLNELDAKQILVW